MSLLWIDLRRLTQLAIDSVHPGMPDDTVRVLRPQLAKAADVEAASSRETALSERQRVRQVVMSGALPRRLLRNWNN